MNKNSIFFSRIYLPILGIATLVWFLIRVIPKPSRAAYPCMRVAAPLASTFVLWLIGLGMSCLFFRKARRLLRTSHYLTAAILIATGAITGATLFTMRHQATASANANTPIGEAKGAIPGRVVWVHDSSATPWKGPGDGHWWQNGKTDQNSVDRMMSKMIRELTGKSTDTAAWDTLFRYYNRIHGRGAHGYAAGEKIVVKTNLTFCNFFPEFCCVDSMTYSLSKKLDYMNTSPQTTLALLRQLVGIAGVRQADIFIGDPVAYYPNEYYDYCHAEFPDVHYIDHAGKFGRTKVAFSGIPAYWSCRPATVKQDYVPIQFAEATYIISLANMTSHRGGGITLCAKNHYGSLIRLPTDSGYYNLHESLAFMSSKMGSYRALVDIMGHAHLGGKTLLYLIDGLYAGNHNYDTIPRKWPVAPFNGAWTSSLFASQDPVAIECVLFDLFQLDTDPAQFPKIAGAEDYLIEAAQADNPPSGTFYDPNHPIPTDRLPSLGVWEHWNNSSDRKYSRNLGTGSGIELLFIDNAASTVTPRERRSARASDYDIRRIGTASQFEITVPTNAHLTIKLFDLNGRLAGTPHEAFFAKGSHRIDPAAITGNRPCAAGKFTLAIYEPKKSIPVCAEPLQFSGK